ncbi:hypothetical protein [Spirochaeta cellobiosiphila]|uniref:hypothetical protein n=1 Tax=Spirochaeta cellobiosiphila TaxID=504483 RepID=UPI000424BB06|nr:hypothetical protein [Spirochaeta cellobiosiphila]
MYYIDGQAFYDYSAIPEWVRLTPPRRRFPIKAEGPKEDRPLPKGEIGLRSMRGLKCVYPD